MSQAYRKLKNIQGHLFIYGHSLSEQDEHLLDAIVNAEKLKLGHLWVGLYLGAGAKHNQQIIQRAQAMQMQRERVIPEAMRKKGEGQLTVSFFDSASAKVWKIGGSPNRPA